ncbi:MAG TPA: DMT family transporter [Blastocatellia bacterium]|nr:DMT family transporter [Blastocatellia bacterium]
MTSARVEAPDGERQKAIVYLIITAVLWSLGGLLIKLVSWNPMAIAGARSAIAALTVFLFLRRPRFTWSAAQLGAALFYAATVILFVAATKLTTAANAILLQYTAPVYIALASAWFLGERITGLDWATIASVLCGMTLFFFDNLTTAGYWGNVCAILSAITFAWFTLFMRKQKGGSPLESVLLGNILAALAGLPFMFDSWPGWSGGAGLLLLGVFQLGLPYLFYAKAIRHVTALEAILIPIVEPILNPIWVLLLTGETPGWLALIGGIIVVGSVVLRGVVRAWRSSCCV